MQKKIVYSAISSLVLSAGQSQVVSSDGKQQIAYMTHPGFTRDEEELIEQAVQIIADRLFKPEILENMYRICGKSNQFLGARVWSRSQLANSSDFDGTHDLLRFQLMCLKYDRVPSIHFYPVYEKTDVQAEACVGCVSCISHSSSFSIQGLFQMKLNRYHLDRSKTNWIDLAGVIVHEMLHNLGHKHADKDYDLWQIRIFENCFLFNGNYSL